MKKLLLTFTCTLLLSVGVNAQNCDCSKLFDETKEFIELNFSGFKEITTKKSGYTDLINRIEKKARKEVYLPHCYFYLSEYLDWFQDKHTWLSHNEIIGFDYNDDLKTKIRKYPYQNPKLEQLRTAKGIEGIYTSKNLDVAVIKNNGNFSDYLGVVIKTKNESKWKEGDIIYEFVKSNDNSLKTLIYYTSGMNYIKSFEFDENQLFLGNEWKKTSIEELSNTQSIKKNRSFSLKVINETTNLIELPSFGSSYKSKIDSLITENQNSLGKNNLIIDLRDNGGGSDVSFKNVMPLVANGPIRLKGAKVLNTNANQQNWLDVIELAGLKEKESEFIKDAVKRMKESPNQMVEYAKDTIVNYDIPKNIPSKVVILINEKCASSAEAFLLQARQSNKVTLVGLPTSGTLDYSNVRFKKYDNFPFTLRYSTTIANERINMTGIVPDIQLNSLPESQWLNFVIKYLE